MKGKIFLDRRVRKTKQQIRRAFVELVEEIGLNSITVSNLAEQADINRGTFYLHYENIEDLVDNLQVDIVESLRDITNPLDPYSIIHNRNELTPLLVRVTKAVANHSDVIKALVSAQGAPSFRVTWEQIISNLVLEKFYEVDKSERSDALSENYLAILISSIYIGVILEWMETGMKEPAEKIASFISEYGIKPVVDRQLGKE